MKILKAVVAKGRQLAKKLASRRLGRRGSREARKQLREESRSRKRSRGRASGTTARRRGPSPVRVELSSGQRRQLRKDCRRRKLTYGAVQRRQIILELERDPCVSAAAARLRVDHKTVRQWRDRYLARGRNGLNDLGRSDRPRVIDAVARCHVVAMACGEPVDFGVAYRPVWTTDVLLETYLDRHSDLAPMGRTSVLRILKAADIHPHRMRYWLHSPDVEFRAKATEICRLYQSPPLGSVVLCVDEKPDMQALGRKHPVKRAARGRAGRFDYEYIRNGTRVLLAAFNPHTGEVYGEARATRKAADIVDFMEEVANRFPDVQVHVVWDNLNIHHDGRDSRWTNFNRRHHGRFHFHYTPIHASWVNQVECFFSILNKRVLRYAVYDHVQELEDAVHGFLQHWNEYEARPFRWTFNGYPLEMGRRAA